MSRDPFNVTVQRHFDEKLAPELRNLMQEVPELSAVAIVPAWNIPQDGLAPAMVVTPDAQGLRPSQLTPMLDRLARALAYHCQRTLELGHSLERDLEQMARQIEEKQKTIQEQEQYLAQLSQQTAEAQRRAAPEGSPPDP